MNVFEVRTTHQAEDQMREIAWHIAVELHNPGTAENYISGSIQKMRQYKSRVWFMKGGIRKIFLEK